MKKYVGAQSAQESSHTKTMNGAFGNLIPNIQKALTAQGYHTPTPIQEQCIPHLLAGKDLLGTAQTGTGKTAAFTLPLLHQLSQNKQRPRRGTPRALILAPTRELAAQIADSIHRYGRFVRLSHLVIFGGVKQTAQVKKLNRGVDILVATPGRLLDLMQQGFIHLNEIEFFILDEMDRMLDMGFIPDIKRILSHIPVNRQTLFFSATMAPKIAKLAHTMVRNPVEVTIAPDKPAVERIVQKVFFVDKKKKGALLTSLLKTKQIKKVIIFTQMKYAADRLVKRLAAADIAAVAIHGNKSQGARTNALSGFKQNRYRALVATDVAARGIDVDDVTHVINYDLPVEAETYIHRIGRTARMGANGDAISLCSSEDLDYLRMIEALLKKPIPVALEHQYHSEEILQAKRVTPKSLTRKSNGGRKGKQQKRRFSRNRSNNFSQASR